LSPIWEELSETVDDSVGIAKVDATKNRDLADKFGVRGYPTLIFIPDDKTYVKYAAGRNLEELLSFVQGGYQSNPSNEFPAPPGWDEILKSYKKRLNKEYLMLEEDFQHILSVSVALCEKIRI
jgi:thiol-disulfide isomerase/thioredoxin